MCPVTSLSLGYGHDELARWPPSLESQRFLLLPSPDRFGNPGIVHQQFRSFPQSLSEVVVVRLSRLAGLSFHLIQLFGNGLRAVGVPLIACQARESPDSP